MIATAATIVFGLCMAVIGYVWFFYPLVALGLTRWRGLRRWFPLPEGFGYVRINRAICPSGVLPDRAAERVYEPTVSLIVAAWNEERTIEDKVRNCLALDYPRAKLEIIFVADGSTDSTTELLGRHPEVKLLYEPPRRGKIAAVNRAVPYATGEVLVFTDADTMLNPGALRAIVRHFAHTGVGCVAGEKRILQNSESSSGKGEGLYWRYESALKRLDSQLWSVVGAAGELFAVRKSLYAPVEEDALIEDFLMSVRLVLRGYRAVYEPGACASEAPTASVVEEMKRRVRIGAGGFQSIMRLRQLWPFWRLGLFGFCYWSHRGLRWMAAPVALFLSVPAGLLAAGVHPVCGEAALALTALFSLVFLCWQGEKKGGRVPRLLRLPYFFVMVHWAVIAGSFRYLAGRQQVTWDKARRIGGTPQLSEAVHP